MKYFTLLILLFSSFTAQAEVWTASNSWSPTWEKKFSDWVQADWDVNFFANRTLANGQKNPYYGLKVDCADTVYSMRIIFAYENRLPFVIQDPTTANATISNKMSRWNKQNEIERVRSFLWYIYGIASTRSLPNDTFPVALTKDWVKPGSLILTTKKNHHSWTVKEILPIGVPWLVYNSVVGKYSGLTLKQRQSWPNPDWVFEGDYTTAGNAGFRYWRPAAYLNKPVWQTPGYSDEQYKIGLRTWQKFATTRLATRSESDNQTLQRLVGTACEGLTGRVAVVNEGLQYLQNSGGKCMDYPTYDTYSSPNRDRRVFDDLIALRQAYKDILIANNGANIDPKLKSQMAHLFPAPNLKALTEAQRSQNAGLTQSSLCIAEIAPGKRIDLAEFKRRLFLGRISNNPHDDFAQRWGESTTKSARASRCKSWDPWSPSFLGND